MPVLAAVAGVVLGLAPQALDAPVSAAAQTVAGAQAHAHLALWHGVTPALLLSAAVIATGLVLVLLRRPVERVAARTGLPFSALDIVDDIRFGLVRLGEVVGRHSGGMAPRAHLLIPSVMLGVLAVVGVLLVDELPDVVGQTARWHDWALVVLVAVGVAATLRARTRIAAMVVVGTVGFGVTLWFFTLGAVDVALTQMLVEVLTVCVMVLLLRRLPRRFRRDPAPRRAGALVAATIAGVASTVGVLAFTGRRDMSEIARYYLTETYEQAGGVNVVNVILVDFRALDTLGEMTVLGVTGLTVAALLMNRAPVRALRSIVDERSPLAHVHENLVYARTFGRGLGPVIIAMSALLLLRGHYEPGGGFIAALVAGAGYALMYLSADTDRDRRLRWPYLTLIGSGVALGTAAGLTGYLTDEGFLAASGVKVLGYGLSTTLVFDMGVYLCVLGLVVAAFTLLGPDTVEEAPDDGDAPEKAAPGAATTREEATR